MTDPATIPGLKPRPPNSWLSLRTRRIIVLGTVALVLVACVGLLIALVMVRSAPRWWRTILREDPATVSLADKVERSLINLINDHKPVPPAAPGEPWRSEPWKVRINPTEANAWLNVRLPMWLANQQEQFHWPRNMSDLQVDFSQKQITVGALVRSGDRKQVLTATVEPRLDNSKLWLPASRVNLGRLGIPASWVLERARNGTADYIPTNLRNLEQTQKLFSAFEGQVPIAESFLVRIDNRRLRILEIQPKDGLLEITCQTERTN